MTEVQETLLKDKIMYTMKYSVNCSVICGQYFIRTEMLFQNSHTVIHFCFHS
jgi:hypothetical protein